MIRRARASTLLGTISVLLLWSLPAVAVEKREVTVPMRDGVMLTALLHLPDEEGQWPVILVRSTYSHVILSPLWGNVGAARGYAVVLQHTRGRFESEGAKLAFETDGWAEGLADGADTLTWIAEQPWCNGKIGTLGGSALGITQYLLAGTGAEPLDCQHIRFATPGLYPGIYWGGVFRKAMIEDWLRGNQYDPQALKLWTSHPSYDDYWKARNLLERPEKANAPALHIAGWYDIFMQQSLDAFHAYQNHGGPQARGQQRIVIGPWVHGAPKETGELTFPRGQQPPNDLSKMPCWDWFDHHLQGAKSGIMETPAVTYYTMGDAENPDAPGNQWRTADAWPPLETRPTPFYLHADSSLTRHAPQQPGRLTYEYDPADPVPTIGGPQLTLPSGAKDQRPIESRVLVFTTDALSEPLEATGRVRAELFVSSDCPDTDFFARLCDVYPDGRSFNVAEGALRMRYRDSLEQEQLMEPGTVYPIDIDLFSTSIIFDRGHRVRLHVTSSSDPGYDPNPNTGEPFRASDRTRTASNTVHLSAEHPSQLILPVPY